LGDPRHDAALGWRARLEQALRTPLPPGYAEPSENRPVGEHGIAARRAGVLIPVVGAAEPFVYFTERSAALRHHPGQISFPGGRVETHDADARAAALREAQEEIDLDPAHVDILGELPEYRTVTGFVVSPFVGWVDPAAAVAPDDAEVARLFAVPLAHIVEGDNFHQYAIERNGRSYDVHAIDYDGDHIWGATAGMLLGLVKRMAHAENRVLASRTAACGLR
jgi:8-oxo-dGTP pyrophosphatase MutT (NUDIX family)